MIDKTRAAPRSQWRPSGRGVAAVALIALEFYAAAAETAPAATAPVPSASAAGLGNAEPLDLATVSCAKYENEILNPASPAAVPDPINTVMWLLGFSVAKSGAHFMYGNALSSFGFSLDAECKDHPTVTMLAALQSVRLKRDNPMDLTVLTCTAFESRHAGLIRTDAQSAATIMMWLFGYSVGTSGGHILDAGAAAKFESTLSARCASRPDENMFNALIAIGAAQPHA